MDWRRTSRWCLFGTVVMLVWLLIPVASCSIDVFRDTPLDTIDGAPAPSEADRLRVEQGKGFAYTLSHGARACYRETPVFDQGWKSTALVGLAAAAALAWLLAKTEQRRAPPPRR
ncbi:MAG: hypothetical protein ABI678_02950 [Kofleriaceae bacterium]